MTRIAFLGSPEAAIPTLHALARRHEIAVVITQPVRPRGRGRKETPTPVEQAAADLGLEVARPTSSGQVEESLETAAPVDLGVVVAYGRILPPRALSVPALGMVNLHFSLLPRWRGAAPVARALMAGDPMSGVSIIVLDEGLDTGPVLTAQAVDVFPEETAGELTARLAPLGARLMATVIPGYVAGEVEPVPQTDEGMTYAGRIEPADRPIVIAGDRNDEINRVRALSPEPGATLEIDGSTHQVLRARPHPATPETGSWVAEAGVPVVGMGDGGMELVEVLPAGKSPMSGAAWLRGRRHESGFVA